MEPFRAVILEPKPHCNFAIVKPGRCDTGLKKPPVHLHITVVTQLCAFGDMNSRIFCMGSGAVLDMLVGLILPGKKLNKDGNWSLGSATRATKNPRINHRLARTG